MSYDQYGQSGQQNNPQGWGSGEGEQNPWSNPQEQGFSPHPTDQPASQPSAGYPGSQPSAGYPGSQAYPGSQPSAGYPGSQASAAYGYDTNQGYNQGYDPGQQQPGQQQSGQQAEQGAWTAQQSQQAPPQSGGLQTVQVGQGSQSKGLFSTLFDFSFTEYATPALAKILYILGIVLGVLGWLSGPAQILVLGNFMSALNPYGGGGGGGSVVLALLGLIIGLIPLAFWIIGLRMALEFVLATVRTQQDTAALRAEQNND
ncbi:DUF4282 domain-containing protein [Enemella evansiae]|nr:DUF4282 domain-containing protein [Enemella evansiae]